MPAGNPSRGWRVCAWKHYDFCIMKILPIAAASLGAASKATAVRANNIVNATTPDFKPQPPVFQSTKNAGVSVMSQTVDQPVNVTNEVLALNAASHQYEASAALVKASEEQSKALLSAVA
jgi:flagellar hook-associated protein FlgK